MDLFWYILNSNWYLSVKMKGWKYALHHRQRCPNMQKCPNMQRCGCKYVTRLCNVIHPNIDRWFFFARKCSDNCQTDKASEFSAFFEDFFTPIGAKKGWIAFCFQNLCPVLNFFTIVFFFQSTVYVKKHGWDLWGWRIYGCIFCPKKENFRSDVLYMLSGSPQGAPRSTPAAAAPPAQSPNLRHAAPAHDPASVDTIWGAVRTWWWFIHASGLFIYFDCLGKLNFLLICIPPLIYTNLGVLWYLNPPKHSFIWDFFSRVMLSLCQHNAKRTCCWAKMSYGWWLNYYCIFVFRVSLDFKLNDHIRALREYTSKH